MFDIRHGSKIITGGESPPCKTHTSGIVKPGEEGNKFKKGTFPCRFARGNGQQGLRPRTPETWGKARGRFAPGEFPNARPQRGRRRMALEERKPGEAYAPILARFRGLRRAGKGSALYPKIQNPVFKNHPRCTSSGSETNRQQRSPGGTRRWSSEARQRGSLPSASRRRAGTERSHAPPPSEATGGGCFLRSGFFKFL